MRALLTGLTVLALAGMIAAPDAYAAKKKKHKKKAQHNVSCCFVRVAAKDTAQTDVKQAEGQTEVKQADVKQAVTPTDVVQSGVKQMSPEAKPAAGQ
jgi:hypothetical protein